MTIVTDIIDQALQIASNKAQIADAYVGRAMAAARGGANITGTVIAPPNVTEPNIKLPDRAEGVDSGLFDSVRATLVTELTDLFRDFFDTFFPLDDELTSSARRWMNDAITQGGSGVNPGVEEGIWQRERSRLAQAKADAQTSTVALWAAKGFPLPPGAAAGAIQDLEVKYMQALNEQAAQVASRTFEAELTNVRLAIQQSVEYHSRAVAAASDYIKSIASSGSTAASLAAQNAGVQAQMISATASYYNARVGAAEMTLRAAIANADNSVRVATTRETLNAQYSDQRVKVAMSAAESVGQQAAAALNGLNSTAQIIESTE